MAESNRLIVLSDRPEDQHLAREVGQLAGLPVVCAQDFETLHTALTAHPQSVLYWSAELGDEAMIKRFAVEITQHCSPRRIFVLSDVSFAECPHILSLGKFAHFIERRPIYQFRILAALIAAALSKTPVSVASFVDDPKSVKSLTIENTAQKHAAIEAIHSFFLQKNLPARVVALLSQSVDELILNAIYDAPVNSAGESLRHTSDRTAPFKLADHEKVTVDLAATPAHVLIGVNDRFGSIKQPTIFSHLRKDFSQTEVVAKSQGVGLSGILNAGQSLIFAVDPGVSGRAILWIPITANYREFKESAHFFSFFGRV